MAVRGATYGHAIYGGDTYGDYGKHDLNVSFDRSNARTVLFGNSANTGNFVTGEDITGLNPRLMVDIRLDRSMSRTVGSL